MFFFSQIKDKWYVGGGDWGSPVVDILNTVRFSWKSVYRLLTTYAASTFNYFWFYGVIAAATVKDLIKKHEFFNNFPRYAQLKMF